MITDDDLIKLTLRWLGFKSWDTDTVGFPYAGAMRDLRGGSRISGASRQKNKRVLRNKLFASVAKEREADVLVLLNPKKESVG